MIERRKSKRCMTWFKKQSDVIRFEKHHLMFHVSAEGLLKCLSSVVQ